MKRGDRWIAAGVAAVALAVYLATLAPGLTAAHAGVDGGDLAAAASGLGVPHPSGYPTYTLLAWLATRLPVGSPAYRVNLLSAACTAAAAGLVCATARRLLTGVKWASPVAAAAGLSMAFSSLAWSQAVIAEVYALLLLCAALVVWLMVCRPGKWQAAVGLALGVGLGNHLTLGFMLPAVVMGMVARRRAGRDCARAGRDLRMMAPAMLAGLLVYIYLPLAAARQPAVNWGDPRTWDRFVWLVSGSLYHPYVLGLPAAEMRGRLVAWAGLLGDQMGWWGLGLALLGAWSCWQARGPAATGRRLAVAALLWAGPVAGYAFLYATDDAHVLLLPLLVPMALAWAMGVGTLARRTADRSTGQQSGIYRLRGWLAPALIVMLPLVSLGLHWRQADVSGDREAEAYVARALGGAAPGALIVTQGDRATFWLWYGLYAEGRRPDVAAVNASLLSYDWYREELRHRYPDLIVPEPGDTPDGLARGTIEANLGRRPVYAADPPDAWREWFDVHDDAASGLFRIREWFGVPDGSTVRYSKPPGPMPVTTPRASAGPARQRPGQ